MSNQSEIGAEGRRHRPVQPTGTVEPKTMSEAKAKVTAPDGPLNNAKGANGVSPNHEFDLDFTDTRGYRWTGRFKCHVLKYKEKVQVGLIRANMSAGVAPEMLDVGTFNLIEMLAHLAVALDDAPKWAHGKGLEELYDATVVFAIFAEVDKHEARFHGTEPEEPRQDDGEGSPNDDGTGSSSENWAPGEAV